MDFSGGKEMDDGNRTKVQGSGNGLLYGGNQCNRTRGYDSIHFQYSDSLGLFSRTVEIL